MEAPPKNLAEHAERLGRKISDEAGRALLTAELGVAFARGGRGEDAAPYLAEAEAMVPALADPNDREAVLAALANGQAIAGQLDAAKTTAQQIGAPDVQSETLATIVERIAERRDFAAARTLIASITDRDWRATAEVSLVKGLLAAGHRDEAGKASMHIAVPARRDEAMAAVVIDMYESGNRKGADRALETVASPHWRAEAAAATARVAYGRGAQRRAIRIVKGIESLWIRARTFAELSGMAGKAGRGREAKWFLGQSLDVAQEIDDAVMRATALTDIAMRLIDRGRLEEAETALAKAPPTATRHKADAYLAGHLADAGQMEQAERVRQRLDTDVIWGSEAASRIAQAHAARGEFTAALEAAARIKTRELRLPALASIAVAHTIAGAPMEEAVKSELERALQGE